VAKEPTVVYKGLKFSLILKKRKYDGFYELKRINRADPEALEREKQRKEMAAQKAIQRENYLQNFRERDQQNEEEPSYFKKARIVPDRSNENHFGFVAMNAQSVFIDDSPKESVKEVKEVTKRVTRNRRN
jgi:hypothetical protein